MSAPNYNLFSTPPPGYKSPSTSVGRSPSTPVTVAKTSTDRYSYPFSINPSIPPPPPPSSSPNKTPDSQKVTNIGKFEFYDTLSINIQNLNKNSSFLNYQPNKVVNKEVKNYPNNHQYRQNNPNTPKCNTVTTQTVTYSTTQTYSKNSSFLNYQQGKAENKDVQTYSINHQYQQNSPSTPKCNTVTTQNVTYLTNQSYSSPAKSFPSPYPQYPVGYSSQALPYSGISYPPPPLPAPPPPSVSFTPTLPPPTIQYALNPAAFFMPSPASNPPMAPQVVSSPYQQQQQNSGYYQNSSFNLKRKRITAGDEQAGGRTHRKKKRPLSQAIPLKKDWSVEDAIRALKVEKESNKLLKSPSLIIKFPDLELNREIVQKFNMNIESVHFQQPSTARYCFVSLCKDADMQQVIKELNETKFGDGFLLAEHKKDRDESENIGPEDIDPLTLYVGNLSQEVTIDDVHKLYPKHKRVDIGFAKKMRYTRYAFVCFKNANDAIEAFQNTHATEMYNKSIIVRFRRLHGTVGLPGEIKQPNTRKTNDLDRRNNSNNMSQGDLEIDETSINIIESTEDEEFDHRTVMQRYITRVKQENPEMEDTDEWYYSEEEDNYDPIPDWLSQTSDSHRSTNQWAEIRKLHKVGDGTRQKENIHQPMPTQTLDHVPKLEVKSERPDNYFPSSMTDETSQKVSVKTEPEDMSNYHGSCLVTSRLQPIIEQAHRPMLEPKSESTEPPRNDIGCTLLNQSSRNPHLSPPFRPLVEPKLESSQPPRNLYVSEPSGNTDLLNKNVCTLPNSTPKNPYLSEPPRNLDLLEVDQVVHRPMLEPKLKVENEELELAKNPYVLEPSRDPDISDTPTKNPDLRELSSGKSDNLNDSGCTDVPRQPPITDLMAHRPMLEPKLEVQSQELESTHAPKNPYVSKPFRNPNILNSPSGNPDLREPRKLNILNDIVSTVARQPSDIYQVAHRPMLKPKLEVQDQELESTQAPTGNPDLREPRKLDSLNDIGFTVARQPSDIDQVAHRPMLEPKLEVQDQELELTQAPKNPYLSEPSRNPDILNTPTGNPDLREHSRKTDNLNDSGCTVAREPLEMDPVAHRPMLEPKLEPPEPDIFRSKQNTSQTDHTEIVQTVMIDNFNNYKVQNNEILESSSIETGKCESRPDVLVKDKDGNSLSEANGPSNNPEETKIKDEVVENTGENKIQNDDDNDESTEDEDSSYDLNNFLTNIKTRK